MKNRRLILWDLDGTLCQHNAQFHDDAPAAVCAGAMAMGVSAPKSDIFEIARSHYPGQRASVVAVASEYKLDIEELFQSYYLHLSDAFLTADLKLISLFQKSLDSFDHGVLTQAPEKWAYRALTKMGLYSFFNTQFICGYNRLGRRSKSDPQALKNLATICLASYEKTDIIVVDDRLSILQNLKDMATTRILMTNDVPSQELPLGINQVDNIESALSLLMTS